MDGHFSPYIIRSTFGSRPKKKLLVIIKQLSVMLLVFEVILSLLSV